MRSPDGHFHVNSLSISADRRRIVCACTRASSGPWWTWRNAVLSERIAQHCVSRARGLHEESYPKRRKDDKRLSSRFGMTCARAHAAAIGELSARGVTFVLRLLIEFESGILFQKISPGRLCECFLPHFSWRLWKSSQSSHTCTMYISAAFLGNGRILKIESKIIRWYRFSPFVEPFGSIWEYVILYYHIEKLEKIIEIRLMEIDIHGDENSRGVASRRDDKANQTVALNRRTGFRQVADRKHAPCAIPWPPWLRISPVNSFHESVWNHNVSRCVPQPPTCRKLDNLHASSRFQCRKQQSDTRDLNTRASRNFYFMLHAFLNTLRNYPLGNQKILFLVRLSGNFDYLSVNSEMIRTHIRMCAHVGEIFAISFNHKQEKIQS